MGDEIFVYLVTEDVDVGGSMEEGSDPGEILMSVDPDSDIGEGQDVEVVLDRSKLHLFDSNGDALTHGLVETPGSGAAGEAEVEGDD
jgi:multiple sugar transport system ATP-binding protein